MKLFNIFGQKNKDESRRTGGGSEKALDKAFIVPERIQDFKEEHYKVLRRLNNKAIDSEFSGITSLQVNIPEFIRILIDLGLLRMGTLCEGLHNLKLEELKLLQKELGIKQSGKKEELIDGIISNASEEDIRKSSTYKDVYVHTEKGMELLKKSINKLNSEKVCYLKHILNEILQLELDTAYREICKKNMEDVIPPGMGMDWRKSYEEGITRVDKIVYTYFLKNNNDKEAIACGIYSQMSGESEREVLRIATMIFPDQNIKADEIRFYSSQISTMRELIKFQDIGIDTFLFITAKDDNVCPICRRMNMTKIRVKDAKIGVNCPPMHKGCRCTIISNF